MIWISYKCTLFSILGPWLCLKFANTFFTRIGREFENWCNLRVLSGNLAIRKVFVFSDPGVHATLANVLFYTFLDSSLEPYLSDFPWIYKYNQTLPGCMNDGINFPTWFVKRGLLIMWAGYIVLQKYVCLNIDPAILWFNS